MTMTDVGLYGLVCFIVFHIPLPSYCIAPIIFRPKVLKTTKSFIRNPNAISKVASLWYRQNVNSPGHFKQHLLLLGAVDNGFDNTLAIWALSLAGCLEGRDSIIKFESVGNQWLQVDFALGNKGD